MGRRSKSDAEETRERLLAAAKERFTRDGYAATSINDICKDLDITKGALFHHFKSKQDLFTEIWTRLQVEMDQEARDAAVAARSLTDPYSAFLAGCRVYLEHAARRDYQTIVLVDGPSVMGLKGWYEQDHDLGSDNVGAGVRYLAKKGIVAEHRVKALAIMLQNALNGAGFALAREAEGITAEGVYDAFETLVKSIR
ncbi:MAG: TetR family transcriptional regulator [Henriciella sp.]|nr:TetR family transcriptional regulator [Henriciella sp.]